MTQIRIHRHDFDMACERAELSTDGHGWLLIGTETYTIYDHFQRMCILHRFGEIGADVEITLTDGHCFTTGLSTEVHEKINAIMREKQRNEYFGKTAP